MKVDITSESPVKKKLSVAVPEKDVLEELEVAYSKLKKQARIPGFRPGKIPRSLLEQRYGPSVEAEVYETLVRKTMVKALDIQRLSQCLICLQYIFHYR